MTLSTDAYKITYNTESGLAAYEWNGKVVATGIYSTVELDQSLSSKDYAEHLWPGSVKKIKDSHGKGIEVTFENNQTGLPTMKQIYQIYEDLPYFVTSEEMHSETPIHTNNIAPIVMNAQGGIDIGSLRITGYSLFLTIMICGRDINARTINIP